MTVKIVPITGTAVVSEQPYDGEYVVTPTRSQQTLETANKTLTSDITVQAIPYSEVGNLGGGYTFYIAKENE